MQAFLLMGFALAAQGTFGANVCVCVCVCICVCRFGVALFKISECKALCGERDEVPSFAIIVHTHTFAWDLNCMKTG